MKSFKQYFEEGAFEDMFGFKPGNAPKVVKTDPPKTRDITLKLYRGFDADIDSLEKKGDGYILSPHKSEQGAIWFSQSLEDAKGRGEWILVYPLKAIKHYQRNYTEDGGYYDVSPENIDGDPTKNSKIWGGVELPDGWLWSYKTQKYIIATEPILVSKDMIHKDSDYNEEL